MGRSVLSVALLISSATFFTSNVAHSARLGVVDRHDDLPAAPSCGEYDNCYDCVNDPSGECGFCYSDYDNNSGKCVQGGQNGPSNGTCPGLGWTATTNQCINACINVHPGQKNCTACIAAGCGFCAGSTSSSCQAGNATNPAGECSQKDYVGTPSQCPVSLCTNYGSCDSCNSHRDCGWCGTSKACMDGTPSGPSMGQCPASSWNYGTCPVAFCGRYSTCYDCVNDPSGECGFCYSDYDKNSGKCVQGGQNGPSNGTCPGLGWTATTNQCINACINVHPGQKNCTACIAAGCGFCAGSTSSSCQAGNATNPAWECSQKDWIGVASSCPVDLCTTHTSCDSCNSNRDCGWCGRSKVCMKGTPSGPSKGQCPTSSWNYGTCPTPFCSRYFTCYDCVNDPSGECGFCYSDDNTGKCVQGGQNGPSNGTCPGLGWTATTNQCINACINVHPGQKNCTACIAAGCGFCAQSTRSICQVGNATNPARGQCSQKDWIGTPSQCPAKLCTNYGSCDSCNSHRGCGWCGTSKACMDGTPSGPSKGQCPASSWNYGTCA